MSLRLFLEEMEKDRKILHFKDSVSTKFEISSLMRSFEDQGLILLFENVKENGTKVVANVCGTRERLCRSLAADQHDLYGRLITAWSSPQKCKIVSDGPAKEKTEPDVDLRKLPILTHFERDAGPYITSAVIHAKGDNGTVENVSIHRLQVLDEDHLAVRLVPRHLHRLWASAKASGKDLDVAISIGLHPAILLAASSPVPYGVNEFAVANALLNNNLKLVDCEHVDASAPAEAELVLEGRISTTTETPEGPFVDITGTYDIQRMQPTVKVVGVSHQTDYIYQSLLPSGAEHRLLMGLPHEALIWGSVARVVPKVLAVNLSIGGCGWLHAFIAIEKQVDGDGKNALLAAFAGHPSLKHAVVVDPDIDVFSSSDVEWAIATRFQASEDIIVVENVRGSTLDSSANQETGLTSKIGIDATRPFTKPKEKFERAKIPSNERVEAIIRGLRDPRISRPAH